MNGTFFQYDNTTLTDMSGKFVSPYFRSDGIPDGEGNTNDGEQWVLSREPDQRSSRATGYGTADEFDVLFNLNIEQWLPLPIKESITGLAEPPLSANIVDVNVIGSFIDYIIQYVLTQTGTAPNVTPTKCMYFRDRNVDGVLQTADYSVKASQNNDWANSILGTYGDQETYIKQFNNSVMLYSNLRMVINGNAVQSYSYTVERRRIGTILVPFGDLQEDYIPNYYTFNQKQYLISKNGNGYIRIIRLGTDIPNRIERIAQYVHKINTVDVINILVERVIKVTAEHGSLDWNNKFEIVNNVTSTQAVALTDRPTYHINSAYNPLYEITGLRSTSMIVDDTVFTLYGKIFNQTQDNALSLNFLNSLLIENGSIDVFIDIVNPPKYAYSLINGIQRFNTQFEGQDFPAGVIVPFPISTKWSMHNEVIAIGVMGLSLMAPSLTDNNITLDIYLYSRQVYFGRDSFILFGVQYVFDDDFIYQDSNQIAMAFGYKFLGCDNQAAYFYNPWDKSVYLFTGSRILNKIIDLTNRTRVKIGRYDPFSNEMILLTENEILKKRDNTIMNYPYVPSDNIIPTKQGAYVQLDDGTRILLAPIGENIDLLDLQTEFIGVDGSTINDYERVDIRLHSPDRKPLKFTVELQTINQDTKESEHKNIELNANEWSIDGYKTIKLIPQYKKGTGLSLHITTQDEIFITGIEFTYEPIARTANSQRSGF
jgi:hypothetical protein